MLHQAKIVSPIWTKLSPIFIEKVRSIESCPQCLTVFCTTWYPFGNQAQITKKRNKKGKNICWISQFQHFSHQGNCKLACQLKTFAWTAMLLKGSLEAHGISIYKANIQWIIINLSAPIGAPDVSHYPSIVCSRNLSFLPFSLQTVVSLFANDLCADMDRRTGATWETILTQWNTVFSFPFLWVLQKIVALPKGISYNRHLSAILFCVHTKRSCCCSANAKFLTGAPLQHLYVFFKNLQLYGNKKQDIVALLRFFPQIWFFCSNKMENLLDHTGILSTNCFQICLCLHKAWLPTTWYSRKTLANILFYQHFEWKVDTNWKWSNSITRPILKKNYYPRERGICGMCIGIAWMRFMGGLLNHNQSQHCSSRFQENWHTEVCQSTKFLWHRTSLPPEPPASSRGFPPNPT